MLFLIAMKRHEKLIGADKIKSGEVTLGAGSPEERIRCHARGMETLRELYKRATEEGNQKFLIILAGWRWRSSGSGKKRMTGEDDWRAGSVGA